MTPEDSSYPVDAPARLIISDVGQSIAKAHAASHAAAGSDPLTLTKAQISDLGDMAGQSASAVAITGGAISGVTFSSGAVTITGGTISGLTDLSADSVTFNGGSLTAVDITGAGTISTGDLVVENDTTVNNLTIGGTLALNNALDISSGGTGAENAPDARSNLGLGNMSIQAKTSVDIDGGSIDGTPIGALTRSTGAFTTLNATSSVIFQSTLLVTGAVTFLFNPLGVASGGTGANTLTGVAVGNGTSAFTAATSSTAGQVLRCTGANSFAFGALDLADTDAVTNVLPATNGGTGVSSLAALFSALGFRTGTATLAAGTVTVAVPGATAASIFLAIHATDAASVGILKAEPTTDQVVFTSMKPADGTTETADDADIVYIAKL